MCAWKKNNGGILPSNSDSAAFRQLIMSMSRFPELINSTDPREEINFGEAIQTIFQSLRTKQLPQVIISNSPLDFTKPLSTFKVLIAALQTFLSETGGIPPLNGTIPDMTSTTEIFIKLQEIYQLQAANDRLRMRELVTSIQKVAVGPFTFPLITDDLIDRFCKNIYNLQTLSTNTIADERVSLKHETIVDAIENAYEDDAAQTPILLYLALRAADRFHAKTSRYPGEGDGSKDNIERDAESVWLEMQAICEHLTSDNVTDGMEEEYVPPNIKDRLTRDHALEITRVGAAELHNIAALVGGVAAQEIVKLVTHQYIPMNNTYVFNGIAGVGATYDL